MLFLLRGIGANVPLSNFTRFCPHMTDSGRTLMNQKSPALWKALRTISPSLVVDVGSLDGKDAVKFAAAGHRVWTFEPSPAKIKPIWALIHRSGSNNSVTLHQVALSNYSGSSWFAVKGGGIGDGTDTLLDAYESTPKKGMRVEVAVRTLDSFAQEDTHIAFMKVDAQGYDYRVLKGAAGLLSRQKIDILVFEYTPEMMPGRHVEATEHLQWMQQMGYACAPCNSQWSRVRPSKTAWDIALYVDAYWTDKTHTRLRGFDNIVCMPSPRCDDCSMFK